MTEIFDLSPTDANNTSVTGESLNGAVANMGRMDNTLQAIMGLLARSIRTNVMRILDNTDDTKEVAFDASALTTATTRTLVIQDKNGTIPIKAETFGVIRTQVFTASGTYTPHANMVYAVIECQGGGAAGGGVAGALSEQRCASGGGAGGYSKKIISKADAGASKIVTVGGGGTGASAATGGAGGTTSVGVLCSALGGNGGLAPSGFGGCEPPAATAADTGDIALQGAPGAASGGAATASVVIPGGDGGASVFGGGGPGGRNGNGTASVNYGAGGGGAAINNDAGSYSGGAGKAGIVIITEFCSE